MADTYVKCYWCGKKLRALRSGLIRRHVGVRGSVNEFRTCPGSGYKAAP